MVNSFQVKNILQCMWNQAATVKGTCNGALWWRNVDGVLTQQGAVTGSLHTGRREVLETEVGRCSMGMGHIWSLSGTPALVQASGTVTSAWVALPLLQSLACKILLKVPPSVFSSLTNLSPFFSCLCSKQWWWTFQRRSARLQPKVLLFIAKCQPCNYT